MHADSAKRDDHRASLLKLGRNNLLHRCGLRPPAGALSWANHVDVRSEKSAIILGTSARIS
jgi:hypothetical protein